jgi:substrate import-associated zinc metallohydrolase lipoprotein
MNITMKKIQYYISALLLMAVVATSMSSCSEDKLGPSIFPDEDEVLDPTATTYQLDKFLRDSLLNKYNLTFLYKMPDVSANMNYNLVPARYENALDLAVSCKYLWFDAYEAMAGPHFLKSYGPRIILLVGSQAISSATREPVDGLSEGGVKITLFNVNRMDATDFTAMNDNYFHTMHREFANILRQNKTYPTDFNTISVGHYVPSEWRERGDEIASEGFVSRYASSENSVDFAETIACYIVFTDAEWEEMLNFAACGWHKDKNQYCRYYKYPDNDMTKEPVYIPHTEAEEKKIQVVRDADGFIIQRYVQDGHTRVTVYEVEDEDGIDGVAAIEQKVQIARQWFRDAWGIDLDALREEVRSRQASYNIVELRQQVYDIK